VVVGTTVPPPRGLAPGTSRSISHRGTPDPRGSPTDAFRPHHPVARSSNGRPSHPLSLTTVPNATGPFGRKTRRRSVRTVGSSLMKTRSTTGPTGVTSTPIRVQRARRAGHPHYAS
jgi:hypothetical protein